MNVAGRLSAAGKAVAELDPVVYVIHHRLHPLGRLRPVHRREHDRIEALHAHRQPPDARRRERVEVGVGGHLGVDLHAAHRVGQVAEASLHDREQPRELRRGQPGRGAPAEVQADER